MIYALPSSHTESKDEDEALSRSQLPLVRKNNDHPGFALLCLALSCPALFPVPSWRSSCGACTSKDTKCQNSPPWTMILHPTTSTTTKAIPTFLESYFLFHMAGRVNLRTIVNWRFDSSRLVVEMGLCQTRRRGGGSRSIWMGRHDSLTIVLFSFLFSFLLLKQPSRRKQANRCA